MDPRPLHKRTKTLPCPSTDRKSRIPDPLPNLGHQSESPEGIKILCKRYVPTAAELGLLARGLSFVPTPMHTPPLHATSFSKLEDSFRRSLHTNSHHAMHPFHRPLYHEHILPPPPLRLPRSVSQYLTLTDKALKRCRAIPISLTSRAVIARLSVH